MGMSMRRVIGQWLALATIVAGVPLVACGGRLIAEIAQDAGGDSATPRATGTTTTPTGSTSTSSAPPSTGSGTSTAAPTGSGTSQPPFGGFPCTAYTAWYYSCPPSAGTSGCKYAYPPDGNPADGWTDSTTQSQEPGCQLDIVAPTDVGGSTCETLALCVCNSPGTWDSEQPNGYCPNN